MIVLCLFFVKEVQQEIVADHSVPLAVAFAVDFLYGYDVTKIHYDLDKLRQHLVSPLLPPSLQGVTIDDARYQRAQSLGDKIVEEEGTVILPLGRSSTGG